MTPRPLVPAGAAIAVSVEQCTRCGVLGIDSENALCGEHMHFTRVVTCHVLSEKEIPR
jgi:hypothetical protein